MLFTFSFFFSLLALSLASMGLTIQLLKLHESLNVRWIPGPQTVRTSNSEKIGAEWFGTQSRKPSFPAGRMELTVILRLVKEPCPGVILVLSDNVDIWINLCAVKFTAKLIEMQVVYLRKSHLELPVPHPQQTPIPSPPTAYSIHDLLASRSREARTGIWPQEREFRPFCNHSAEPGFLLSGSDSGCHCLGFPCRDCTSRHESHSADDKQLCSISRCCTKWNGLERISASCITSPALPPVPPPVQQV